MTYQEVLDYIKDRNKLGSVPGLYNIKELLKRLGNPEKKIPYQLPQAVRFNEALARGTRLTLKRPDIRSDDVAVLQYTGGTTGVSKGAVLLHSNIIANALQSEAWNAPAMQTIPAGQQPTSVCALPLYHIFAFTVNMMLGLRMGGKVILIPNPRDLKAVLKELSRPLKKRYHNKKSSQRE